MHECTCFVKYVKIGNCVVYISEQILLQREKTAKKQYIHKTQEEAIKDIQTKLYPLSIDVIERVLEKSPATKFRFFHKIK